MDRFRTTTLESIKSFLKKIKGADHDLLFSHENGTMRESSRPDDTPDFLDNP
jgi:hypothetical protein